MVKILCVDCNKPIHSKGKRLKLCTVCKSPICNSCRINEKCKQCNLNNYEAEYINYMQDKYEELGVKTYNHDQAI